MPYVICWLQVLDLHDNELSHVPEEIGTLVSLQVLNLQNNRLKSLPSCIGNLTALQILNVNGNFCFVLDYNLS